MQNCMVCKTPIDGQNTICDSCTSIRRMQVFVDDVDNSVICYDYDSKNDILSLFQATQLKPLCNISKPIDGIMIYNDILSSDIVGVSICDFKNRFKHLFVD